MRKVKNIYAILLIVFTCALLSSCTNNEEVYINNETINYAYESNDEDKAVDDVTTDIIHGTPKVFTGLPIHRDYLLWTSERDREWEQDIRHFGVMALRQHPLLIDFDLGSTSLVFGIGREDYSAAAHAYEVLLRRATARNGLSTGDSADEMREALRWLFIERINELILDIPNLNDNEIIFGIAAIAVILDDAHTRMGLPMGYIFPVEFIALYDGIYFVAVPEEYEHALYGELLAINDIGIDEIMERLATIIAHENEYYLRQKVTMPMRYDPIRFRHYVVRPFLKELSVLNYLGVVDDSGRANFTVRCENYGVFTIRMSVVDRGDVMDESSLIRHEFNTLMHTNPDEIFWHEYLSDESLMYVRINSFASVEEMAAFNAASSSFMAELENRHMSEKMQAIVIDVRQNPGGNAEWPAGTDFSILSEAAYYVYVVIDGGAFSKSVINTSHIMHRVENAITIGEPTGQIDNILASHAGLLPNSRMRYNISLMMWVGSDSEDIAIRPDVFIPLSIDDVINQRDPALEYIISR